MSFEFVKQKIEDVILIKPKAYEDNRGFFMESYKKSDFTANGINKDFIQENHSYSNSKVLRGLHYQIKPFSQAKLIKCIKGSIYDIALDIRPNSATFKQYIKVELSEENKQMLYIPEGFAHGFVVMSENAQIIYKTTKEYNPISERGIFWNDKDININWEIDFEPILSKKDENLPKFNEINLEELK